MLPAVFLHPQSPQNAPLWVKDINAAYPEGEWLCGFALGADRESAGRAALLELARVFSVDIQGELVINEAFTRRAGKNGKAYSVSAETEQVWQAMSVNTRAAGLVGVQSEFWTDSGGTVYANARMNRRECAARYSLVIEENEGLITRLREEAAQNGATFEAHEMLSFAASIAAVTDNCYTLRSVLDPRSLSQKRAYGNADTLRMLARNAARSIVIAIEPEGEPRVTKALASFFTRRGFSAGEPGGPSYRLSILFRVEEAESGGDRFRYADYELQVSLRDQRGKTVFVYSSGGTEGHRTAAGARERCIRAAEHLITGGEFALRFEAYLASLPG
jgi:hypothetical protein